MNDRLATRDLAELLSIQTGLGQKRAEIFLDALSSYISQSIERNKSVKILGLGTFKVVLVRERESVHIQTGERFIIPAHHKLSFIPDKDFKEQINRPFAFFEPIETMENNSPKKVSFMSANETQTIDEIVDELDESLDSIAVIESDNDDSFDNFQESPVITGVKDSFIRGESYVEDYFEFLSEIDEDNVLPESDFESDQSEQDYAAQNENIESISIVAYDNHEETGAVIDEGENDSYLDEENKKEVVDDSYYNDNTIKEKHKSMPTWILFLLIPFLLFAAAIIAWYAFFYFNISNPSEPQHSIVTAEQYKNSETNEPMPIGTIPMPDEFVADSIDGIEIGDDFLIDDITDETPETEIENNAITSIKKEEKKVIDWLAPSSEKPKTETKRAEKPNEKIESKNRELAKKTDNKTNTTSNTDNTASKTSISTTTDQNKEKVVPKSVRMSAGTTLMQLALEHYGDKVFWVYIYDYNKGSIKNYNNIPVGTELRLPLPRTYGINSKNKSSVDKAKQKQSQLLNWNN